MITTEMKASDYIIKIEKELKIALPDFFVKCTLGDSCHNAIQINIKSTENSTYGLDRLYHMKKAVH